MEKAKQSPISPPEPLTEERLLDKLKNYIANILSRPDKPKTYNQ